MKSAKCLNCQEAFADGKGKRFVSPIIVCPSADIHAQMHQEDYNGNTVGSRFPLFGLPALV